MNGTCQLRLAPAGLALQPAWRLVLRRRDLLCSPHLPAALALAAHLLLSAPYLVLDVLGERWPGARRFRISEGGSRAVCLRRWFECLGRVLLKYLTAVFPVTALLHHLRSPALPALAPSCVRALLEVLSCLLLFDAFFFAWHVLMHRVSWLFVWVHRQHHHNRDTFALVAQDASAIELLSLQLLAIFSAALVGCHPLSEVLFHLLNIWLAVEDHSGYDLPWALHRVLPCFGGAPFHLAHHRRYRGNYAPYFRHWDWLFGTYLTEETANRPEA
ncbi:cholesterol 25-hydroxylase-like protein [Scleropages formosus]|uniref:Cholesterol 25-hydroxylase-like protein n=1 Tax=Scleropages formosus TaxID=113540 RepID=A0A8C9WSH7_SCLFO|nr:cholesterol 25-hydroxylase-like protein [Scleropages formosus]